MNWTTKRIRLAVLGILIIWAVLGIYAVKAEGASLSRNEALLNGFVLADNISSKLYRDGYLTDEITDPYNSDQSYAIDAEVTRARHDGEGWRVRVYFYDGPNDVGRFIGMVGAHIEVRHGKVVATYHWLREPHRPF